MSTFKSDCEDVISCGMFPVYYEIKERESNYESEKGAFI